MSTRPPHAYLADTFANVYVAKVKLDSIRGFHDARSVDLDFARPDHDSYAGWTVLVGRNGAGKTTLLRAIALALAGPSIAPTLIAGPANWVTAGRQQGGIELDLAVDPLDVFAKGFEPPPSDIYAGLIFNDSGVSAESNVGRNGPWQDNPSGWLSVAYGPYRRLGAGTSMPQARPVSRLAGLFREDMSLSEGVSWLIGVHLRAQEKRPGASELRDKVLALLGDELLPDERQIRDVDAEGLWVEHDGVRLPLREMGDGYRSVGALIADLLKHIHAVYGDIPLDGDRPVVTVPGVVLIDEIEAHLHPAWQQSIGDWLRGHFPRIQFIVTTNSPFVCQSADPAGLVHLPDQDQQRAAYMVEGDLYQRVVFGSSEDIVLSPLFGLQSPYSTRATQLRQELVDLELKVLDGQASDIQLARYHELQELLVSSPSARTLETAAMLRKERARRGTP